MTYSETIRGLVSTARPLLNNGIVCIGENHAKPFGRILTRALLETRAVKYFFIEYDPAGGAPMGDATNAYFRSYRKHSSSPGKVHKCESDVRNIRQVFDNFPLQATDAEPNVLDLALIALQHGAEVFAADPLIKRGTAAVGLRNDATVQQIRTSLPVGSTGQHSLALWGQGHFAAGGRADDGIDRQLMREGFRVLYINAYGF